MHDRIDSSLGTHGEHHHDTRSVSRSYTVATLCPFRYSMPEVSATNPESGDGTSSEATFRAASLFGIDGEKLARNLAHTQSGQ